VKTSPELDKMIGEWIGKVPGPFGPAHPELQLVRSRTVQQMLVSKCMDAADELIPQFSGAVEREQDPEILEAFAQFAIEAGERKWPGVTSMLQKLATDEATFWGKSKVAAA
jgi:hypothetical protein